MRARKGAATHLYRAAAAVLIFGLGALSMSTVVNRGRATPHHSGDWKERSPLVVVPDREFAASSYVHQHLRADVPRDSHSDASVANLQRQIGTHYGVVSVNIDQYSPPLYVIGGDQPTVRVRAERASDPANPLSKGTGHPYFGVDGILRCAKGWAEGACYADSNNRLSRFPLGQTGGCPDDAAGDLLKKDRCLMREQASIRSQRRQRRSFIDARFDEQQASCLCRRREPIRRAGALA
jgi:hypothetical protein